MPALGIVWFLLITGQVILNSYFKCEKLVKV